jgi:hypothetical protein
MHAWLDKVHALFLVLMIYVCHRTLWEAKRYGKRLRMLRTACAEAAAQSPDDAARSASPVRTIIQTADGDTVFDSTRSDAERDELVRILSEGDLPRGQVLFRNLPDAEDMAQQFAFFHTRAGENKCASLLRLH